MANPTKKENINSSVEKTTMFFSENFRPPKKNVFRPKYFFRKIKFWKKWRGDYKKWRGDYESGGMITKIIMPPLQGKKMNVGD